MKTSSTPVAVKPAQTATATPAPVKTTKSQRPTEKVLTRVHEMSAEKAVKWLNKTSRTIANHYDVAAKQRKCTEAYWNGLMNRYEALSKQAQTQKAWSSYCKSINKPVDHTGVAFIA
jgi:hypothetical protein